MKNIKVGLHYKYYGYETVVYGNGPDNIRYVDVPFIPFRKLKYKSEFLGNVKLFSPFPKVDLFHTYNNVVMNQRSWIVSFESFLPRFLGGYLQNKKVMKWGFEKLASNYCKAILPISDAAKKLFYGLAKENDFDISRFEKKTEVLYPGIMLPKKKDVFSKGKIKLLFIGNLFFLKGGRVIVDVFEELQKNYPELELTIISRIDIGDHISQSTENDKIEYLNKIKKNNKIKYLKNVEHKEIMEKYFPEADINLLLSFDETFGFVVAEGMLAGLPTITTNIFAFPEMIENGKNGFILNLPVDEFGMIEIFWEKDILKKRKRIFELEGQIKTEFKKYLIHLIEDETQREKLGKKSREAALKKFGYKVKNEKLLKIYQDALN